jgi:hypothetical protein
MGGSTRLKKICPATGKLEARAYWPMEMSLEVKEIEPIRESDLFAKEWEGNSLGFECSCLRLVLSGTLGIRP